MGDGKRPNSRLAALMSTAGVTNKGLARRICDASKLAGEPVRCDHTDVKRWLDGMAPRDPKPRFVAQALALVLGRHVSLEEIGFGQTDRASDEEALVQGATYLDQAEKAVDVLDRLVHADLHDRPHVMHAPGALVTAPQVITGYLFANSLDSQTESDSPPAGLLAASIRETTADLMMMDFKRGGGHTRRLLLHYFRDEVVPLLRGTYPAVVRRDIFGAAAEVAQLLGWSAYDAGRHGAATRYFVQGLRLAREAEDDMMGGRILSNLSHQANFLGQFDEAVKFARAAQAATGRQATPTVSSLLLAMEARALASLGESKQASVVLLQAERLHSRGNPASEPAWVSYFNAAELASEASHIFRDLGLAAQCREFAERSMDPMSTPPRTLAFMRMVGAAGTLASGELELALQLASDAVPLGAGLQSARYLKYLADFQSSLAEVASTAAAHSFDELVNQHHPLQLDIAQPR